MGKVVARSYDGVASASVRRRRVPSIDDMANGSDDPETSERSNTYVKCSGNERYER